MMKFFIFIATLCVMQMTNSALAEDGKSVIAIIVASNQNVR
jgi:hypothetical protein